MIVKFNACHFDFVNDPFLKGVVFFLLQRRIFNHIVIFNDIGLVFSDFFLQVNKSVRHDAVVIDKGEAFVT